MIWRREDSSSCSNYRTRKTGNASWCIKQEYSGFSKPESGGWQSYGKVGERIAVARGSRVSVNPRVVVGNPMARLVRGFQLLIVPQETLKRLGSFPLLSSTGCLCTPCHTNNSLLSNFIQKRWVANFLGIAHFQMLESKRLNQSSAYLSSLEQNTAFEGERTRSDSKAKPGIDKLRDDQNASVRRNGKQEPSAFAYERPFGALSNESGFDCAGMDNNFRMQYRQDHEPRNANPRENFYSGHTVEEAAQSRRNILDGYGRQELSQERIRRWNRSDSQSREFAKPKYQRVIDREKQQSDWRQRRRKRQVFEDDEGLGDEPKGHEWRRRKREWLLRILSELRPKDVVIFLNDQRKWIIGADTKLIIENLVQSNEAVRAYRVLKWEMMQPWYIYNFKLSTQVANLLANNSNVSRAQDLFDLMIEKGNVPDVSTYTAIVNAYIWDGGIRSLHEAWALYKQMTDLEGYALPTNVLYDLFEVFVRKGLPFLCEADGVFIDIRAAGLVASQEMYDSLMHLHRSKGDQDRVDSLMEDMKGIGVSAGQELYASVLRECAKDGNVIKGEEALKNLEAAGPNHPVTIYISVIKMYGKAGFVERALEVFEKMKTSRSDPILSAYVPIIEVLAGAGYGEDAENLLKEAQEKNVASLQPCYNALMEMYSERGSVEEVEKVFNEMQIKNCNPNIASWNLLITTYTENALMEKAEALFEEMKRGGCFNKKTFELMLDGYGREKNAEKLKEVFLDLANTTFEPQGVAIGWVTENPKPEKNTRPKLTQEQREILVGVLLGGAQIESYDGNQTHEICFRQDPNREEGPVILNHLYVEFALWAQEPPKLEDSDSSAYGKTLLSFKTANHLTFKFFAIRYRPDGVPRIPKLIHRWLTPRALAYWYMYGGGMYAETRGLVLNSLSYTDKEISFVLDALEVEPMDCTRTTTKEGSIVHFKDKSAVLLWELMEPHLLHPWTSTEF